MNAKLSAGLYAVFDLGTVSVKAACIELAKDQCRLVMVAQEPLRPHVEFPGDVEYQEHQSSQLKVLADRLPLSDCKQVLTVFHHREQQVKIIDLPEQIKSQQIESILAWEAKKLLSPNFQQEPFLYAFQLLETRKPSAIVAVIPRSQFEAALELYAKAGITLSGAYNEAFVGIAAKDMLDPSGLPATSIINIGHASTHLLIFSGGNLRFYRQVPSGVGELDQSPSVSDMEVFAQKIRFSFDYFRAVSKLARIDEILLLGGGAQVQGLLPFLVEYFTPGKVIPLDLSSQFDISPVLPTLSTPGAPDNKILQLGAFLPAIGAFLAHASDNAAQQNLIRRLDTIKREELLKKLSRSLPVTVGITGLLIILLALGLQRFSLKEELDRITQEGKSSQRELMTMKLKVAKLENKNIHKIMFSPRVQNALHPLLKDHYPGSEILLWVSKAQKKTISIENLQVLSKLDAEQLELNLEEKTEKDYQGSSGTSAQPTGQTSQTTMLSESLVGFGSEILVIKGKAAQHSDLARFIENLTNRKLIKRFRLIKAQSRRTDEIHFILKGDLP